MRRSVLSRACAVVAAVALGFAMGVGHARGESLDDTQSGVISTAEGVDVEAADAAQSAQLDTQSAMTRTRSTDERRSENVDAPADDAGVADEPEDDPPVVVGRWVADAKGWRYEYSDGTAVRDRVMIIDGVAYAFNVSGYVARGWYRDAQGKWCLSSDDGLLTGWQRVNGAGTSSRAMASCTRAGTPTAGNDTTSPLPGPRRPDGDSSTGTGSTCNRRGRCSPHRGCRTTGSGTTCAPAAPWRRGGT